ncbi:DUF4863 family protein [Neopusillimonas aromaticivorans]|jgi:hypothetical protein|uniref:DUF4863 family protein n=1 Tax=Neopusillimonas aromaticivorans TaxID=2979868 RepID=UPI00259273E4|nr:DUF4863 family protein [Neopusillimonas aromaticivorans]NLZ10975.1 DUF4863 family protein [Alcaligenaceae bacterium]WJJ92954.1 DUF4863 family protein [Neopusillimonas aromaticivorans]
MNTETFQQLIQHITDHIGNRPLDKALQDDLNTTFPADGAVFRQIADACKTGVAEGWMCQYEAGGLRYGRVIKPSEALNGFSVDVVDMKDIAGPHHRHPNGEIDLIMPVDDGACFDGQPAGWLVYGPDTAHSPTVTKGEALVLYLLPQGAIEFTKR